MPRDRNPQPFGASFALQGQPAEIGLIVDELIDELINDGFDAGEPQHGRSPLRAIRLERGTDEWLVVTVALPRTDRLVRPAEYDVIVCGLVRGRDELHERVSRLPFTPLELKIIAQEMPLTASATERMNYWLPDLETSRPLAGHGAIFTIHHQTDFVLMLEKAIELGIETELVTVIDKEYRYRNSRRVDAYLRRRLGVPVYTFSEIKRGISDHIRRVEKARQDGGQLGWAPTIVVDDGGYILPRLIESFGPFLSFFKGVVEQTTSGIWALQPFRHDLPVPIFSVAESELKATVEAHGVAQAGLTNLRQILPQEKFEGRRAIVVGYGTIGQALADLLRRQNVDVHVHDSSAPKLVSARERGLQVGGDLPELIESVQPRYVFACAGPGAVGAEALTRIRADCALVSLTSRDTAFDKTALGEMGGAERVGTIGTVYRRSDPLCSLILVADGYPINFHFAESMPNQQSDLVMASLLVGAVTLASAQPEWPAGNDPTRANAVLAESTLLNDFLKAEPPLLAEGRPE
ncbi:MAG: adenosylhomocysteinase [Thermoleophilaceae bacterium]|jgi:S-adenosylhomocysteine hydrolase|nr:adenosylhomocysteinase [Thermoleophilaceae bacterium]